MRQCGRHIHGGREIRRAVLVERHLWMAVLSQIAFDLLGSCEAYSSEFLEICGVCHSWNVGKAEMVDGAVKRWTCQRKRFDCLHCFGDRKSTRLNSSHSQISYAVFCLRQKHSP